MKNFTRSLFLFVCLMIFTFGGYSQYIDSVRMSGSVQLSVSILFIILGSLVFPCGGMTGGRRPEGIPPQGKVYIL